MFDLPPSIRAALGEMGTSRTPAYLQVDAAHRLVSWGGSLSTYGLTDLHRHHPIGEQVMCLEGLLPLDDPTFCLPWVELQPGCYADIHLFTIGDTVWVLLLNATPEASKHRQVQQRVNAAALASTQRAAAADLPPRPIGSSRSIRRD